MTVDSVDVILAVMAAWRAVEDGNVVDLATLRELVAAQERADEALLSLVPVDAVADRSAFELLLVVTRRLYAVIDALEAGDLEIVDARMRAAMGFEQRHATEGRA